MKPILLKEKAMSPAPMILQLRPDPKIVSVRRQGNLTLEPTFFWRKGTWIFFLSCSVASVSGTILAQNSFYMSTMVLILVFAAFTKPVPDATGPWPAVFAAKWDITTLLVILAAMLKARFTKEACKSWIASAF